MIEEALLVDPQDLRLLKGILSDSKFANDFTTHYGDFLFTNSAKPVATSVIDYVKKYRVAPTFRILEESCPESKDFLQEVQKIKFDASELAYDLDKIKGRFERTETLKLRSSLDGSSDSIKKEIRKYQENIGKLTPKHRAEYKRRSVADYADEFASSYVRKLENPELAKGVMTGYTDFDFMTNGLQPADLVLIAGETNSGKSQLLANMAAQIWLQGNKITDTEFKKGYNVLYFSLEMTFESCFRRFISKVADLNNYNVRDAALKPSEVESMDQALSFIKRYPAVFDIVDLPRGATPEKIEQIILEASEYYQPDVVIIDYLGLMDDDTSEADDWLKLGNIAGKVHELSRIFNIPFITAAQMNRVSPTAKIEERIGNHRLGRSSLISTHCSIILMLEQRPDESKLPTLKIHTTKSRESEKIEFSLEKRFANSSLIDMPGSATEYKGSDGFELSENQKQDITALLSKYQIKL